MNFASNFIPNNEKTFIPRDSTWLTENCGALYRKYHRKYKQYVSLGYKIEEKQGVDDLRDEYTQHVNREKEIYLKKNLALKSLIRVSLVRNIGPVLSVF